MLKPISSSLNGNLLDPGIGLMVFHADWIRVVTLPCLTKESVFEILLISPDLKDSPGWKCTRIWGFWLILLFTRVKGTQKSNAYLAGLTDEAYGKNPVLSLVQNQIW